MDPSQLFSLTTLVLGAVLGYSSQALARRSENKRQDALSAKTRREAKEDERARLVHAQLMHDRDVVIDALGVMHDFYLHRIHINSLRGSNNPLGAVPGLALSAWETYAALQRRALTAVAVLYPIDAKIADAANAFLAHIQETGDISTPDEGPADRTSFELAVITWLYRSRPDEAQAFRGSFQDLEDGWHRPGTNGAPTDARRDHENGGADDTST